jgi:general secretion pathway protein I
MRCKGFTLVEILVALSIIAIGMTALIKASGDHTGSASYLKQKTLAHYVAMNEIARLQITHEWPPLGEDKKSSPLAGHEWYWTREILETEDEKTHAVRIKVFADEERKQNIAQLMGYLTQIAPKGDAP